VTQRNNIEKIKLSLSTPIWTTIIVISKDAKDAEDTWKLAKKTFTAELKEVMSELKGEMGDCKILIEPVCVEHTL
jgi:methionyl-tRNA synthetase